MQLLPLSKNTILSQQEYYTISLRILYQSLTLFYQEDLLGEIENVILRKHKYSITVMRYGTLVKVVPLGGGHDSLLIVDGISSVSFPQRIGTRTAN